MYKLSEINWKKIVIVDLLSEKNKLFGEVTIKTIFKYKRLWKKILFIVNRKWYSSSSLCTDCWYIPKCKFCDVPISKHIQTNWEYIYVCSMCHRIYNWVDKCENCWWTNMKDIWIWTYKFKDILKNDFGLEATVIENTDINTINKIKKIKLIFNESKIIISTWILSFSWLFEPDIIIFPNADTWLTIPDFNVSEKHFLNLYEFIKNYKTKNFIIQTYNFDNYVYKYLSKLDLNWFWKTELSFRKQLNYPPFSELAVIIYKNQIEEKLYSKISKLESELKYLVEKINKTIEINSTPQLIFKKFGKYHYNIILKWENLKSFLDKANDLLKIQQRWFQIDRMPVNLV